MKKQFLIPSVMFGLLSALVISARTPFPAQAAENDALAVAHEHIQLVQAIRAAEQEVGGIASKAEYKQRKEIGQYKVEVVRGYDVFDVVVDADNGSILKIKKDEADHEGCRDDRDLKDDGNGYQERWDARDERNGGYREDSRDLRRDNREYQD